MKLNKNIYYRFEPNINKTLLIFDKGKHALFESDELGYEILQMINANNKLTAQEIANQLNIDFESCEMFINELKDCGVIDDCD